jgi:hypothetical protein
MTKMIFPRTGLKIGEKEKLPSPLARTKRVMDENRQRKHRYVVLEQLQGWA